MASIIRLAAVIGPFLFSYLALNGRIYAINNAVKLASVSIILMIFCPF